MAKNWINKLINHNTNHWYEWTFSIETLWIRTKKDWKGIKLWTGFVNLMGFAWTKIEQLKVEFYPVDFDLLINIFFTG